MNSTDIYRQAIKRTFSQLYSVPPSTVDVAWSNEGESIVVRCAGKTFIHLILRDSNDDAPQFLSINEDLVVTLTDEERQQLERAF
jgi:hypothetical protein